MLNMNSPTVQSMLKNMPSGLGNMPVYYGNTPTITTETGSVNQNEFASPYPSPRDMVINSQLPNYSQAYQPTQFYNPYSQQSGYNLAFNGYYNPYMASNWQYNNEIAEYYRMYNEIKNEFLSRQDTIDNIETANILGISLDDQMRRVSDVRKAMSRSVNKYYNISNEVIEQTSHLYDLEPLFMSLQEYQESNKNNNESSSKIKTIKLKVIRIETGEVVIDTTNDETEVDAQVYENNIRMIQSRIRQKEIIDNNKIQIMNWLYDNAIERQYDNTDLLEYFNGGGAAKVLSYYRAQELEELRRKSGATNIYDKLRYKKLLQDGSVTRDKDEIKQVQKFIGRNGILPNGMPISPQHDPNLASCFSYNPQTGSYDISAPNFIKERIDKARAKFLQTLDQP